MNAVKLQGDAEPDNPWVKDYISIRDTWVNYANENNLIISGLITPYGINMYLEIEAKSRPTIKIHVQKKLENVRGSDFSLKIWPISQLVTVKFGKLNYDKKETLICVNSIWNNLKRYFPGYSNKKVVKNKLHLFNDKNLYRKIIETRVIGLNAFYSLQVGNRHSELKLLKIPTSDLEIKKLVETCIKLQKEVLDTRLLA